jgi:hypothetical protein
MTYQLIPNPTDLISVSQGELKTNFTVNQTAFDVDHVDFNVTGAGRHKKVTLNDIAADPTLTYPVSEIYAKTQGTAPNLDLDLYYAAPRQNLAAQINRFVPTCKMITKFNATGAAGSQNAAFIANTVNVNMSLNGIIASAPFGLNSISTYTVTFTNALDYDTYYVFITHVGANNGFLSILTQTTAGFTFQDINLAGRVFGIMVI